MLKLKPAAKYLIILLGFSLATLTGCAAGEDDPELLAVHNYRFWRNNFDAEATALLQICSAGIVFLSLSYVCIGAIHGIGKVKIPLIVLSAGMRVQFIITYLPYPDTRE